MPWPRLRADLRHFKEVTSRAAPGKRNAILMGRRTWDSVPAAQRPLPGRLNVVISRQVDLAVPEGVLRASSLDDAMAQAAAQPDVDQVMVIGGGEIFRQAMAHPRLRFVYYTRIAASFEVDAHFPALEPLLE